MSADRCVPWNRKTVNSGLCFLNETVVRIVGMHDQIGCVNFSVSLKQRRRNFSLNVRLPHKMSNEELPNF